MRDIATMASGVLAGAAIMVTLNAYGWPAAISLGMVSLSYVLFSIGFRE